MPSRTPALNTRVLTVVLLVGFPVLVVGAAIVMGIGQARLREAESARLAQVAEYTAGAVDAYVFRRILDAALLARVPDIRRAAAAGNAQPLDRERVRAMDHEWQSPRPAGSPRPPLLETPASQFLADLVHNDSVYREVIVTDRHGRLVAASNITTDFDQSDEDWWIRAFDRGRGRVSVSDVRRDDSAGVYAFEIAVPVPAPTGEEPAGIMKVVADSREMLVGIAGLELGIGSEAMLVRPDGSIVFGRQVHAEGERFFAAELLRQRLDDRASRKEATGTLTFDAQGPDDTPRIVAVAPSQLSQSYPELSWMVALSLNRDELRAPFRSLVMYLILAFALTAIAVLAIALWLSLRLAAPTIDPAYDMHLVEHPPIPRIEDAGERP